MTYVISDIHGCYDRYMEMLEKIKVTSKNVPSSAQTHKQMSRSHHVASKPVFKR